MSESRPSPASFRDPSGFVFERCGDLYRQVGHGYRQHFDRLIASGLYAELRDCELLIPHEEVETEAHALASAYKLLKPERIPFISYPYEWCFSALKDAALLTLNIQKRALKHHMSLKDASAYNVQLRNGRPIFIDTLSFEIYREGEPWVAYRQFCRHFLAPLALMSLTDIRLKDLLVTNLDGIPLELASELLSKWTLLRPTLLMHIHLHANMETSFARQTEAPRKRVFGRTALLGLIDSLESAVQGLHWRPTDTAWLGYDRDTNYSEAAAASKRRIVADFLELAQPETVWDLGANTGEFSRMASSQGIRTIAFDADPACVERAYLDNKQRTDAKILPLVLDLTNPTPALGWGHSERMSLAQRGPADAVLALALLHHLAIGGNVPFRNIAEFFQRIGRWLLIEFVPKSDSQVGRLLVVREDIFDEYHQDEFQRVFRSYFMIIRAEKIADSERTLYLLKRIEPP